MAFPEDPLDLRAEVQIGGVWTDITSRLRTSDPLVASYGMSAEGSRVDPSTCTLMLDNSDGALSPRNPMSPWYGSLGRNIPVRGTVPGTESYLALDGTATGIASTPDAAALDIVGDIDVRVEATADWGSAHVQNLIGKWTATGNQRSWIVQLNNGLLYFWWSADGSATHLASYPLPVLPPRAALRVTLDVNNGTGGLTAAFYWATALTGPWTVLGTQVSTDIGTTSIYNSSGPLLLAPASPIPVGPWLPAAGRVHRAEVRSGITGTVVANPDFRALAPGTTSFADTTGKMWSLAGTAEVSDREYLFSGEMSKSPPRWVPSGQQVWVPVEAAGILRRLGQGRKALDSTLRRKIPAAEGLLAYWPMEEQREATQAYSPIAGVKPMRVTGLEFASVDTLASSSPLPAIKSPSSLNGVVPPPPSGHTAWHLSWLYRIDTAPTTDRTYMGITSSGTVRRWAIAASTTGSQITGYDADGDTVFSQAIATGLDLFGQWVNASFRVRQVASDVEWQIIWRDIGGDAGAYTNSFAGTMGRCTGVISPSSGFHGDLDGMAIGHITVVSTWDTTAYIGAVDGYAGETALARLSRLALEEPQLPLSWIDGDMTRSSTQMGPQRPAILTDLLQECADTDGGILMERQDRLGLVYRDRTSLENQPPKITLDYAARQLVPPLEPVDDDKGTRNDRTVTRVGGSSARVVVTEGPLSVLPPEEGGVGSYDDSVTLNLYDDDQPIQVAGWLAHLGTWDEARYPSVKIRLDKLPWLIPAVLGMRIGDNLRIINPPSFVAPGPIDLQVRRITHTPRPRVWEVTFECLPAGPWNVGVLGDPVLSRADTSGSELATVADPDGTALSVTTTVGPRWTTDPADFPLDILVGGEVVTVSGIGEPLAGSPASTVLADAFTRTVSGGWGTATSGDAWSTSGGTAGDYAVNGSAGTHAVGVVGSSRRTYAGPPTVNADVTVTVSTDKLAAGAAQIAAVMLRYQDLDNLLMAQARLTTSQTIQARIVSRIGGVEADLTPAVIVSGLTHTAGGRIRIRAQVVGTLLRVKLWSASSPEPPIWHLTALSSALMTAGPVGLRSLLETGNTNTLPVTVSFDDFTATEPGEVTNPAIASLVMPVYRTAAAVADTQPVTVVVVGSSTAAGQGGAATNDPTLRSVTDWAAVERARHNSPTVPGRSGVPAANIGITNGWTRSGGANVLNRGLGFTAYQLGVGNYIERPWYGTAVTVLFEQGAAAGTFTVSIDGGAATTITPSAVAAVNTGTWTSAALTAGNHTVRITGATGNTVIEAVYGHERDVTSGVQVWNGGLPGASTAELATTPGLITRLGQLQPSLVVLMLTSNDYAASVSPATTKARVQAWLTSLFATVSPTPDVLLVHQHQRFDGTPAYPWTAYLQAAQEIADADHRVHVVDVSGLFPTSQAADVWDLIDTDNTHLTERGHQILTDALASVTALPTGTSQVFTLSARSVNGIVKPHLAGADVRLATPTIVAL